MNVKLYTAKADFSNYRSLTAAAEKPAPSAEKAAGNYDKVTIRKQQASGDGNGFARILAKTIADRVAEGTGQGEVAKLQAAVSSGSYQPDARRIAERMLGYR